MFNKKPCDIDMYQYSCDKVAVLILFQPLCFYLIFIFMVFIDRFLYFRLFLGRISWSAITEKINDNIVFRN